MADYGGGGFYGGGGGGGGGDFYGDSASTPPVKSESRTPVSSTQRAVSEARLVCEEAMVAGRMCVCVCVCVCDSFVCKSVHVSPIV